MDPGLVLIIACVGTISTILYLYLKSSADANLREYARLEDQGVHDEVDGADERRVEEIMNGNPPGS